MSLALKEAWKAFWRDEVPVGAVVVYREEVIAHAHNAMEGRRDATAHAEMLALSLASARLQRWRLSDTILFTTLEPCSMCAGAALLARIPAIVWGAPDLRHGAAGSWIDLFKQPHPTHSVDIQQGPYSEECALLMKMFFQQQRGKKHARHHPSSSRTCRAAETETA